MLTRAEPHGARHRSWQHGPRFHSRGDSALPSDPRTCWWLLAGRPGRQGLRNRGSGPVWGSGACLGPGEGGRAQRPEGRPLPYSERVTPDLNPSFFCFLVFPAQKELEKNRPGINKNEITSTNINARPSWARDFKGGSREPGERASIQPDTRPPCPSSRRAGAAARAPTGVCWPGDTGPWGHLCPD